MKLTMTAKKMTVSQAFTDHAEACLNKLDKFFEEEADAKITMAEHKNFIVLELTVRSGSLICRAEQSAVDKNDALDACIDKIIRQIRKNKTKLGKRIKETALAAFDDDVAELTEYDVIRRKQFVMRPMLVDEAILQMNMLGHQFFMFRDAESGSVNVVYRREDGHYAVLEPVDED